MGIPLLEHPLSTQNSRVTNLAGDNSTVQIQNYGSVAAGDSARDANVVNLARRYFAEKALFKGDILR